MSQLILMRHGESEWNRLNLFTGWVDVPLSSKGIQESLAAGQKIMNEPIDIIFTSRLVRALMTALLAMSVHSSYKTTVICHSDKLGVAEIHQEETKSNTIPLIQNSALNERCYGKLQGLNKRETIAQYGEEQVQVWRRSFDGLPPGGESLAMTAERVLPFFQAQIVPFLEQGKNIFIAAHGNSLRAIIMLLEHLDKSEVLNLELATGNPIIYNYHNTHFTKRY